MDRGLRPEDIRVISAAAGGPKWMTLYPLYRYIFGKWLTQSNHKIELIGASAGAWSMACAAQEDALSALELYLKGYAEQTYPTAPTKTEISEKCSEIISGLLGTNGVEEILHSDRFNLSVITSPSLFDFKAEGLKSKLFLAAGLNLLSRKNLNQYFQRNIFSVNKIRYLGSDIISTKELSLNQENINQVLLASGAIPTVIDPVKIDGQVHWDGGITDYHLDLNYQLEDGLVLHPHFHHTIIPGWLDKYIKIRMPNKEHHDRTVLIYPTKEFINSLPMKKIPTRDDFKTYFQKDDERIRLWYETVDSCKSLAEEFKHLVNKPILEKDVQDIT